MSPAVALPGLRADSPAAALALYGLAALVGPGAIRWAGDAQAGWHGELSAEPCESLDGLAEVAVDAINADPLTDLGSIAKDLNKVLPEDWKQAVTRNDAVGRLASGMCAEAPLRREGQAPFTPLCVISFKGRGSFFGPTIKQDRELTRKRASAIRQMTAFLREPWMRRKDYNTLGLDPGARRQDGAIIGPDPSADGVWGVPALVPLALRGLATVAPMPASNHVRGGAFIADGPAFSWPVFTTPVPTDALPIVAARDWAARTPAQRAAAGVEAVFASRILRDERRLAHGRRIA